MEKENIMVNNEEIISLDEVIKSKSLAIKYGDSGIILRFKNLKDWSGEGLQKYAVIAARIERKENLIKNGKAKTETEDVIRSIDMADILIRYGANDEETKAAWGNLPLADINNVIKSYMEWTKENSEKPSKKRK